MQISAPDDSEQYNSVVEHAEMLLSLEHKSSRQQTRGDVTTDTLCQHVI